MTEELIVCGFRANAHEPCPFASWSRWEVLQHQMDAHGLDPYMARLDEIERKIDLLLDEGSHESTTEATRAPVEKRGGYQPVAKGPPPTEPPPRNRGN